MCRALWRCLSCTASVHAATIVNDTWQDGTDSDPASPVYSENGTDSEPDGDIESAWFQGGDGIARSGWCRRSTAGKFSSPTGGSSAAWTTLFYAGGNTRYSRQCGRSSESHVGIHAYHYQRRSRGVTSNTSQNFRFGVVDSRPLPALLPMAHRVARVHRLWHVHEHGSGSGK